ncbi:MAG TPA: ABC transporter permease [Ktedonobacteraceae bacterium]|nr:ABC transporter permease [Ktedonobacteraceae bacterium]
MDTRDKNQQRAAEGFMTPDSGMSQAPIDMDLAVLTDSDLSTTLGENELKDLKEPLKKPATPFQESMRRLTRDKRAMACVGIIIFFVLLALFGPFFYQRIGGIYNSPISGPIGPEVYHTFYHQELSRQDELPSWVYYFYSDLGKADMQARQLPSFQYWLGTDQIGRDILARLMQGILISITVALLVEVVDVGAGITVGVLAGFNGGAIDQVLARFTDIIFAFPGLLFIILVSGIWGEWADTALSNIPIIGANGNARLLVVSLALAFVAWPLMARYVRGQTLQLKEQQFIEAARTAGTSNLRIMMRHIVPNLFSIVIVASTLNIVGTIIGEAGISLLGLGVQPPGSSIGLMISQAQPQVATHPWEILVPTVVLTIFVLAFSFLGDGLRDAFDPRSKD